LIAAYNIFGKDIVEEFEMITSANTREIKNTSVQAISILVKPKSNSAIFSQDGNIRITPNGTLVAEENRFDLKQLQSLQRKKLISVVLGRRAIRTGTGTGTEGF
jgi:hypothetical protein